VLGILTNYADNSIPLDNLAFIAYAFNAGPDFHRRFLRTAPKKFCTTLGQPSSTMLQIPRLDMATLRKTIMMVHLELGLHLGHRIKVNTHEDKQRSTS